MSNKIRSILTSSRLGRIKVFVIIGFLFSVGAILVFTSPQSTEHLTVDDWRHLLLSVTASEVSAEASVSGGFHAQPILL
jgi:hypothetical protein